MGETATGGPGDDDAYGGLPGAFPYAFRASESRLLQSYVLIGGLAAALIALLFVLGLVVLFANTVGARGGVFTFSRTFFLFVGLLVIAPLLAPVLSTARRHRRGRSDRRADALVAAAGYLFIASLYVALVISVPESQQEPVSGTLAPLVAFLYALPRPAGLVPPVLAALLVYLAHRTAG